MPLLEYRALLLEPVADQEPAPQPVPVLAPTAPVRIPPPVELPVTFRLTGGGTLRVRAGGTLSIRRRPVDPELLIALDLI